MWSSKWSIKDEHKLLSELGSGAANGGSPYYDAQTGFPTVTTTSDLYESISTMTQAQSAPVYTPPIGTSLGESLSLNLNLNSKNSVRPHFGNQIFFLFTLVLIFSRFVVGTINCKKNHLRKSRKIYLTNVKIVLYVVQDFSRNIYTRG